MLPRWHHGRCAPQTEEAPSIEQHAHLWAGASAPQESDRPEWEFTAKSFGREKKCKCLSFIFFWCFWMSFLFISQCIFKGNCLVSFIQILLTHSYLPSLFPGTEAQLVTAQMRELCVSAWSVKLTLSNFQRRLWSVRLPAPDHEAQLSANMVSVHLTFLTTQSLRGQRNEGTTCQAVQLLSCCGCGHAPPKTKRTSGVEPSTPKSCKACVKRHWDYPIKSSRQQPSLLSILEMKGRIPFSFTAV